MFFALMLVFWITIQGANYPSAVIQSFLFGIEEPFFNMLASVNIPLWICNMTVYGVYRVLAWIVSVMLPPMAIFSLFSQFLRIQAIFPVLLSILTNALKNAVPAENNALLCAWGLGAMRQG